MKSCILICAATKIEAQACRRGVLSFSHPFDFEVLQTGMGLQQATKSLNKRLMSKESPLPSMIVSAGFAGTQIITPQLGSWILGTRVSALGRDPIFTALNIENIVNRANLNWKFAAVESFDTVQTGKVNEAQSGPRAIDMESYALGSIAKSHSIPFEILRMVSDTSENPIPSSISSFVASTVSDNHLQKMKHFFQGAASVVSQPVPLAQFLARSKNLPDLLQMGWRAIVRNWN